MKRIAAMIFAGVAFSSHAAFFSDDEARQQIFEVRAQTQKIEGRLTQVEAGSKQSLELLNQIEKLREDFAALQGKIEVLQFNQEESVRRQKDLYVDLDARLRAIEQAKVEQAGARQAAEQKQLDEAVALVKSGKHKEGVAALTRFARENPQSSKLPEANYWLGVGHSALKDYKAASAAFGEVTGKAADNPRAPDALLGLATVAAAQKDTQASRKHLVTIIEKYPQSEAAVTARKALTIN